LQKYLYTAVFISGMTSLGVEMAASRLLGNIFGTSNLVWASIIGLILLYLAAGYFLGGRWADRSPSFHTFSLIQIWSGISISLVPVISRPILRIAANAFDQLTLGVLFGSFASVLVLLAIPITLLGTISPFAIRLAVKDMSGVGRVSGRLYAISTLGSFLGTFLPVLVLIPLIGTYKTFLFFGTAVLILGLVGLWFSSGRKSILPYLWSPLLIPAIALGGLPGTAKATPGQIYETESAYNYIQVLENNGFRYLRLNEGQGIHSIYHPSILNYEGPWEQVSVAPFFNQAPYAPEKMHSMAIVGLAAGTAARQATAIYGPIPIDGFEIDPQIVSVGRQYFGMTEPNLNVIIQDGRWGLEHSSRRYQVISVDAYRPPYIPFHLTTKEFFQIVYDHLEDDGVMAINVGRGPNDRRLINALGSTILSVFPTLHVMDVPNSFNSIIFATKQPSNIANLADNFIYLSSRKNVNPLLLDSIKVAIAGLQPPIEPSQVFTDDVAPIEWITNNMILNFIFSGDMEVLQ
jgi:spermidine synthase